MRYVNVLLLFVVLLFACSSKKKEIQGLKDFISAISVNDNVKARSLVNLESPIMRNSIDFNISKINNYIKKFGYPSDTSYTVEVNSEVGDWFPPVKVRIGDNNSFIEVVAIYHKYYMRDKIFILEVVSPLRKNVLIKEPD